MPCPRDTPAPRRAIASEKLFSFVLVIEVRVDLHVHTTALVIFEIGETKQAFWVHESVMHLKAFRGDMYS